MEEEEFEECPLCGDDLASAIVLSMVKHDNRLFAFGCLTNFVNGHWTQYQLESLTHVLYENHLDDYITYQNKIIKSFIIDELVEQLFGYSE